MKVSNKTIFEELEDLKEKVVTIRHTSEYKILVQSLKVNIIENVDLLSVAKFKGWLFNFYSKIGNLEIYDTINERSWKYLINVKTTTSVDDIAYCNFLLIQKINQVYY